MNEKIMVLENNKDIDRRLEETTGKTDGCDPDVRRSDL